jgi:serine protease Do
MNQDLASSFKLTQLDGALVSSVQPGSPADKAGLQLGDLIVGFGTGKVKSSSDLPLLVGNTSIGTQVPVKLLRAGVEKTLDVTIAKLDSAEAETPVVKADNDSGMLGLTVSALNTDDLKGRKLSNGVLIEEVFADSAAEKAGLETGDIIVSVNNQSVSGPSELKMALQAAPAGKPIAMLIMQGEATRFIAITKP